VKFPLHRLPNWLLRLYTSLSRHYVLVILVFVVWVGFFDANSLVNIFAARRRVSELQEKKRFYQQQIDVERRRLYELHTNRSNLEKFAREQYYMRRPTEDVYVVIDDE